MINILCLDTGAVWGFSAKTPYEAMQKLKYTLDLKNADPAAEICETKSGRCLYMDHSGQTWSVINR